MGETGPGPDPGGSGVAGPAEPGHGVICTTIVFYSQSVLLSHAALPSYERKPMNRETLADVPQSVSVIEIEGKTVYLTGTAHLSHNSVADVAAVITRVQPDTVCVELCEPRFKALRDANAWRTMDVFKVVREGKALFLLAQLFLASFYRQLGKQIGITPGAEILEAITRAQECGAHLELVDRSIEITLKRIWGTLSFWKRLDLIAGGVGALFTRGDAISEVTIENLKQRDQLEAALSGLEQAYPEIKRILIDERDIWIAQSIRMVPGNRVVAVVGAGHVAGITEAIRTHHDLEPLKRIPPPSRWPRLLKWGIPAFILALFAAGFLRGPNHDPTEALVIWIVVNGSLSALGAALALGHPLTIVGSFIAAPLTSLNPTIGAGMVAGTLQAWVKKPTVNDLEHLAEAVSSFGGFWRNPVTRILLVTALVTLGSALGTFVSGSWIAARLF